MKARALVLAATHAAALGAGFAAGVYVLPILIAPSAPSACFARLPRSPTSDRPIQSGTAAVVNATPIKPSPLGEKAQSSDARKLSISKA